MNANIISEDDVTGQYHAFGPTPDPIGVMPAGCTVCSTSCMGNCSGDCTGGCGDANCEGQCSLTCESSCSADCTNTCMETCSGGCNLECVNGCRESCTSGCSGACQGCTGCSGSCIDACVNGCKHSCMNVNTTSGTHAIVPEWPSTGQIEDEDIAELLRVIKSYLNVLMQYDYKRISELDEAVVLHDADRFVGQIVVDGSPEDIGEINLADLNLVISDFDGRTVRITAASLVEFIRANYKNYWVWTPVIEEDEYGNKTTITWNFHSSFDETTPDPIYLADLVSGGIGTVTPEHPGLMPSELFVKLDGKDFIYFQALTGNNTTGEAAPAGTTLIRLAANFNGNTDAINVFNTELLGDLDARYAPAGTYVTEASLNQYKTFVSETYATNAAFTSYQTSVSETYETIANASATYATIVNFNALTNRVATTEANIATLNTNLSNIYTKTQADAKFVERGENARTQVPARVATVVGGTEGKAGLMLPGDIDSINSAIDTAQAASTAVTGLTSRVTANERAIADLVVGQAYATTDYQEGTVTPGTVRIPVTSSVVVGENGAIDIKKYTVTNLIKNSTFVNGFATNWVSASNIDEAISNVEMDSTLNITVATLAFVPDGVISQSFYSDVRDGINISITFKRHASADKIIEVKLDTETYVSHTITHGIGYYVAEFHFDVEDRNYLSSHTLYIHNPDTSNTVSYEIVNIMVQEGRKYTGWNTNPYDAVNNSVNIVTYSNQIKFQDLPEKYTEDVYDQDQVTLLHRAGDYIDPSSSVIMHKNSTYFFIHLTAANTVDGVIRNDAIPLRIDLDTGVCDISGNAVTAGTLRDTADPSITLNVPVAQMNEFFAGTSTSFVKDLNMYNSTDTSVPVANRQLPKVELTFKRTTSGLSSVDLATTPLVGAFDSNTNKNGEIFNDYGNNSATGDYSHASGQNTIATANASTAIGKYNVADGTGVNDPKHLFIVGNGTADNDRSNIVEVSDNYMNLNGIFKQNGQVIDFSTLGKEIVEMSDTDYAALVTKDPNKLYLVYESVVDNRTVIVRDSNGDWKYSASIYGVVAAGSPCSNKFATDSDAPTTPPTKVAPQLSGTDLIFSYTTAEKTVYFQNFSSYSPVAGGRANDMDASNCYFQINDQSYLSYSVVTAADTLHGPFVAAATGDYAEFAVKPKPNGYLRIYKDNKLYATNEPPAASVVSYDSTNSGLTATTAQDAIDELKSISNIQYSTMPTASADLVGEIVQFIGTTDSTYIHGCYYECVNESSVYSWKNVSTDILASANNNGLLSSTMYGTINDIPNTYLSQSDASTTYLSKSDASSTYLSKTDASSTYLTQANAATTYVALADIGLASTSDIDAMFA